MLTSSLSMRSTKKAINAILSTNLGSKWSHQANGELNFEYVPHTCTAHPESHFEYVPHRSMLRLTCPANQRELNSEYETRKVARHFQ